jgi:hypothetical protein
MNERNVAEKMIRNLLMGLAVPPGSKKERITRIFPSPGVQQRSRLLLDGVVHLDTYLSFWVVSFSPWELQYVAWPIGHGQ